MTAREFEIRRVNSMTEVHGCAVPTLPVVFSGADTADVERALGRAVASLAIGESIPVSKMRLLVGSSDIIAFAPDAPSDLARIYAGIMRRPCIEASIGWVDRLPDKLRSLTLICGADETDIAAWFQDLTGCLSTRFGGLPPLGVMTAETTNRLTWVLAKQLLPHPDDTVVDTTIYTRRQESRPGDLTVLSPNCTMADIVYALEGAKGTLLINAHSRPHCGIANASDGAAGICGFTASRLIGHCTAGVACYFGGAPRAFVGSMSAQRLFFNGCTTAGVGGRRADFLPRNTMVAHAALGGAVREMVGNVHVGFYDDRDLDWFIAASALGISPASAAVLVDDVRLSEGQERFRSCLYFGDAANPPWPISGARVGTVCRIDDGVRVSWDCPDRVLIAEIGEARWAELAAEDRLHCRSGGDLSLRLTAQVVQQADRSILMVLPNGELDRSAKITVELRPLAVRPARRQGEILDAAAKALRWLEATPVFEKPLEQASRRMQDEAVVIHRFCRSRGNLMILPELLAAAGRRASEIASSFDALIVKTALNRSRSYWNWQAEYSSRMLIVPQASGSTCPHCNASAKDYRFVDFTDEQQFRIFRTCAYCGIVLDTPEWPLNVRLCRDSLEISGDALAGEVEIRNTSERQRNVCVGVAIERGGLMRSDSSATFELRIDPGASTVFRFRLLPEKTLSDMMQARIYIASEGAFGLVGSNLLFGVQS